MAKTDLEDDVEVFDTQLRSLGHLARIALVVSPESGGNEMAQLLVRTLMQLLDAMRGASSEQLGAEQLHVLCESAHWLLLIATHVLCVVGERSVPATLNWLSSRAANDESDAVLQLSDALLALLEADKSARASPLLARTELWSLAAFLRVYAFPAAGRGFSPRLAAKFSGAAGDAALTFVVQRVMRALSSFAHEQDVVHGVAHVLDTLARSRRARELAQRSEAWQVSRRNAPQQASTAARAD